MRDPLSIVMALGGTLVLFGAVGDDRADPVTRRVQMVLGAALIVTGVLLGTSLGS